MQVDVGNGSGLNYSLNYVLVSDEEDLMEENGESSEEASQSLIPKKLCIQPFVTSVGTQTAIHSDMDVYVVDLVIADEDMVELYLVYCKSNVAAQTVATGHVIPFLTTELSFVFVKNFVSQIMGPLSALM